MDELDNGTLTIEFTDGSVYSTNGFQYYNMQFPFLVIANVNGSVEHYNTDQIVNFIYSPKEI